MSDEPTPKLRLKPKLAPDLIPAQANPAFTPPPVEPPAIEPPPAVEETKAFRLKPRLAPAVEPTGAPSSDPVPASPAPEIPPAPADSVPAFEAPPPFLPPEEDKPARKFSLKPKSLDAATPSELLPEATDGEIPVVNPVALPIFAAPDGPGPDNTALPRPLTTRPFPPPANLPSSPAGGVRQPPPWVRAQQSKALKHTLLRVGGTVVILLVVSAGGFVAYQKMKPVAPAPIVQPKAIAPESVTPAPVEQPVSAVDAAHENASAESADAASAAQAQAAQTSAPPTVVVPPPASAAFKAWVENLRVGGVRTGETTRVFIGGTAYATGDVVNAQLGIIFDSYNPETRRLVFRDRSGAVVDKRN